MQREDRIKPGRSGQEQQAGNPFRERVMARKSHVLIAGAGIGGLTAALACFSAVTMSICVRTGPGADGIRRAGIQLAANGSRLLIALGLGDAMRKVVCEAAGKEVRILEYRPDLQALRSRRGFGPPFRRTLLVRSSRRTPHDPQRCRAGPQAECHPHQRAGDGLYGRGTARSRWNSKMGGVRRAMCSSGRTVSIHACASRCSNPSKSNLWAL